MAQSCFIGDAIPQIASFLPIFLDENSMIIKNSVRFSVPNSYEFNDETSKKFGLTKSGLSELTTLGLSPQHENKFSLYDANAVNNWDALENLLEQLLDDKFKVYYRYDDKPRLIYIISQFKYAILSENIVRCHPERSEGPRN